MELIEIANEQGHKEIVQYLNKKIIIYIYFPPPPTPLKRMNCSFCRDVNPSFTEEKSGNAFCNTSCQTGFYDKIGIVFYNPETKQWMPKDLIIMQLIRLPFDDLFNAYKAFPELRKVFDSDAFEKQWLKSFDTRLREDLAIKFISTVEFSAERKFRMAFVLFDGDIQLYQLTEDLIRYALQFRIYIPNRTVGEYLIKRQRAELLSQCFTRGLDLIWNWLYIVRELGNVDILRVLLSNGGRILNITSDISIACQSNHIEMVKFLLTEQNADPNDGMNQLVRLVTPDRSEIVKILLSDPRIELRDDKMTEYIIKNTNLDAIEMLLKLPAFKMSKAVIKYAIETGRSEVIQFLHERYPDFDLAQNEYEFLRYAMSLNHLAIVSGISLAVFIAVVFLHGGLHLVLDGHPPPQGVD